MKEEFLFEPESYFHVYNHGNAKDNVFLVKEDYEKFIRTYKKYIFPIAKTYAFCLMPNHFHFAIQIRNRKYLEGYYKKWKLYKEKHNFDKLNSKQFSNFFNSYTKSFNIKHERKGKLFLESVKRKKIEDWQYFKEVINYIHLNPIKHNFTKDLFEWPYCSYQSIIKNNSSLVEIEELKLVYSGLRNIEANPTELKFPDGLRKLGF